MDHDFALMIKPTVFNLFNDFSAKTFPVKEKEHGVQKNPAL